MSETIRNTGLKPGDTVELFVYGSGGQVCVKESESSGSVKATYIGRSGGSIIFGSKGAINSCGFITRNLAGSGWQNATDKAPDFESYTHSFTCGDHVECRVIPKTTNKSLIGMGLGLIVAAGLNAWLKNAQSQTTGVRAPELEEQVEEEEIEVEVDLSELTNSAGG